MIQKAVNNMAYLTYDEYTNLSIKPIALDQFEALIISASNVLNGVTRNFYKFNDLAADVEFRRESFKLALAAQIDYFHNFGALTSDDITGIQSISLGRTNITLNGNTNASFSGYNLSHEALNYLYPTGLLYRGLKGGC